MPAVAHVYGMGMDVCFAPVRKTLALMDKSGSNSCQCRRHLLSMWCMWCLKEGQRDDSDHTSDAGCAPPQSSHTSRSCFKRGSVRVKGKSKSSHVRHYFDVSSLGAASFKVEFGIATLRVRSVLSS